MAKEIRSGAFKIETTVSKTLADKLARDVKKRNTSVAQILRDLVQAAYARKK